MNTYKMYLTLAQVSGFVGVGMLLGGSLASGTSNTPYWIGGILVLAGAVLLGMSISLRGQSKSTEKSEDE